ncbi:MAG TPA: tRNA dihydrouridine synthase DusB [Chthoniobacterales bacterium]|nr:tRNA dihydrouridine synthase DusB [Chthoniobacterales bacterium]
MLPWFNSPFCPLYLAPMAGVTDSVFRRLCKEQGADVVVSEFVSADGILHRNERTREMIYFQPAERPLGVQLFGADPERMAAAALSVVEWVEPDFIDLNFGCPVNKVVSKQGGSALLRDCPLLERVASTVVRKLHPFPVTAKIRLGWDQASINALQTAKILEDAGVQAIAIHGRTKDQGYSGDADWDQIARVAGAVSVPVIGNGDLRSVTDIGHRIQETGVRGLMIGRAAMNNPWIFRQARAFLRSGIVVPDVSLEEKWDHILRHCRMAVAENREEEFTMASMRGRLMAYSKGMLNGRQLRSELQRVTKIQELEQIRERHTLELALGSFENSQ